jgi:hypothetical protein
MPRKSKIEVEQERKAKTQEGIFSSVAAAAVVRVKAAEREMGLRAQAANFQLTSQKAAIEEKAASTSALEVAATAVREVAIERGIALRAQAINYQCASDKAAAEQKNALRAHAAGFEQMQRLHEKKRQDQRLELHRVIFEI